MLSKERVAEYLASLKEIYEESYVSADVNTISNVVYLGDSEYIVDIKFWLQDDAIAVNKINVNNYGNDIGNNERERYLKVPCKGFTDNLSVFNYPADKPLYLILNGVRINLRTEDNKLELVKSLFSNENNTMNKELGKYGAIPTHSVGKDVYLAGEFVEGDIYRIGYTWYNSLIMTDHYYSLKFPQEVEETEPRQENIQEPMHSFESYPGVQILSSHEF